MKVVNICFRRGVRLFGNIMAPQSIYMGNADDARNWKVTLFTDERCLRLEALPDNPIHLQVNLTRRSWYLTLNEVESIMLEAPVRSFGQLLAPTIDPTMDADPEQFLVSMFTDPAPASASIVAQAMIKEDAQPGPVSVPLEKNPEAIKGAPGFPHLVNGKPPKKK